MRNKRNFLTRDAAEQEKHRKERDRSNAEQKTCHKQQKNKRSFETRVVISDLLFWRYLFFTCAIFSKINSCRNGFYGVLVNNIIIFHYDDQRATITKSELVESWRKRTVQPIPKPNMSFESTFLSEFPVYWI